MLGIVIVAHGGLAREYKAAMEHVVGHQDGVRAVSVGADHDREAKKQEITQSAQDVDQGQGVVIVTDMYGGSPTNLARPACHHAPNRKILYGANLPLLLKLAKCRNKPLDVAVAAALDAGRKYIDCCDG